MNFDFPGYPLEFIQKRPCKDGSAHLFTMVFKFFSPVTKYHYIIHADYHTGDVFAVKFYCKKDRHSDLKYSKIVNRGDIGNILLTCARVIPILMKDYPMASFAFTGARTFDIKSGKLETYSSNQRFKVYRYFIAARFGSVTFAHYEYATISSYLLVNRCHDVALKEQELIKMFSETYLTLPDVM